MYILLLLLFNIYGVELSGYKEHGSSFLPFSLLEGNHTCLWAVKLRGAFEHADQGTSCLTIFFCNWHILLK